MTPGGRRVLVTGAAGAIGSATVSALRARGATVVGLDRAPAPGCVVADLRNSAEVAAAVEEVAGRLGGLDVIVNNAGVGDAADAGAEPGEAASLMMEVNFFGAWRATAAAMPHLLESRGRVVTVASGLARVNLPYTSAYAASKRAVAAWMDALRIEYGDRLEAVTTVYPGYIRTPIHDAAAARGYSMAGAIPPEPIGATVKAIVSSTLGRPARDVASTRRMAAAMLMARLAPALVDAFVSRRARRFLAASARASEPA